VSDAGHDEELPAWSLDAGTAAHAVRPAWWSERIDREWAWGGSTGAGVNVAVVDSGVEAEHPAVGAVQRAVAVDDAAEGIIDDTEGDVCGHGTACAGIIRTLAPDCELYSVRVLGPGYTGSGGALLDGLEWAIESGARVINLSLSTTKSAFVGRLHELADRAYFRRTVLIASAHNMPVDSYPWRFASVVSVGSHDGTGQREFYVNADPPVEFFARGVDVEVAWPGEGTIRATGNSFAAPHIAGMCALILAKHPELTPFELKSVLAQIASTAGGDDG
jgi:subtilisin